MDTIFFKCTGFSDWVSEWFSDWFWVTLGVVESTDGVGPTGEPTDIGQWTFEELFPMVCWLSCWLFLFNSGVINVVILIFLSIFFKFFPSLFYHFYAVLTDSLMHVVCLFQCLRPNILGSHFWVSRCTFGEFSKNVSFSRAKMEDVQKKDDYKTESNDCSGVKFQHSD